MNIFQLLDVEKYYVVGRTAAGEEKRLKALDGVRLEIREGDTVALVGESGSGKSTLVRLMLGLEQPTNGRLFFRQTELREFDRQTRQNFAREVSFIYQNARGSMNPRMRVGDILAEPMLLFGLCKESEARVRVGVLLDKVGLSANMIYRFPAELSGGQVRRVAVARALASEPKVIIADECVAGLDVSVQAQLLNLLRTLCTEMGLTLVFITHDLGVASYLCKRTAVMYLGCVVEQGPTIELLTKPLHPYTRALTESFPSFERPLKAALSGEIPSPINLPQGCRFSTRCSDVKDACRLKDPPLILQPDGQRGVACLFPLAVPVEPLAATIEVT